MDIDAEPNFNGNMNRICAPVVIADRNTRDTRDTRDKFDKEVLVVSWSVQHNEGKTGAKDDRHS